MTTERTPEVGETWTHRYSPTYQHANRLTLTIKAIDGDRYWCLMNRDSQYYTYRLADLVNAYQPPKTPLRKFNFEKFPFWMVVRPQNHAITVWNSERVAACESEASGFLHPVIRIDGVDEDGKVIGEQIL